MIAVVPARPTLGLCMIVRDEAETIGRCIASVRGLVDGWTIVDTGSADATPELVRELLGDLPGTLHRRPWRDFGANRSELMALARGSADHLLLLDADMTVRRDGPLPPLTADAYTLRADGPLDYAVPRVVRGDRAWRFEGATHEHLACDGPFTQEPLAALAIVHHADGGARDDKLARDQRLLEAALERDPGDLRALFYLAQTCRDRGDRERAAALYARRAGEGGWWEERFYAAYQAGLLRAADDPAGGARALLEACALAPGRAEPLCDLARVCREQGWHAAAYRFAARGLTLPYPAGDLLFVHRDVYEWRLRFERSIAAWWIGRPAESLALADALLAEDALPPAYADAARRNRRFALESLGRPAEDADGATAGSAESAAGDGANAASARAGDLARHDDPVEPLDRLVPSLRLGELRIDVEPDWPCCNPSIAADGDGFRMLVRSVNFTLDEDGYTFLDDDRTIRSLSYAVRLDRDLQVTAVAPLEDRSEGPPRHRSPVLGYEDCRLVFHDAGWHALATVLDRAPTPRAQMALLSLSPDGTAIERVRLLPGAPGAHEKNWVPFAGETGPLRLLYAPSPAHVLRCDVRSGTLAAPPAQARWRPGLSGGSQGVPFAGGHLFVLHEVRPGPVFGRSYAHRFGLVRDERLVAQSPPFTFAGEPIEYCAGLAHGGDGRLVLSFGVWDRVAALATVDGAEVLAALRPLERDGSPGYTAARG
jgi:glycosyltransferase involved in cell wall biosynthesis